MYAWVNPALDRPKQTPAGPQQLRALLHSWPKLSVAAVVQRTQPTLAHVCVYMARRGLLLAHDTHTERPDSRRCKDVFIWQDIKTSGGLSGSELKPGVCRPSQGELSPSSAGRLMETQRHIARVCTICFFSPPSLAFEPRQNEQSGFSIAGEMEREARPAQSHTRCHRSLV